MAKPKAKPAAKKAAKTKAMPAAKAKPKAKPAAKTKAMPAAKAKPKAKPAAKAKAKKPEAKAKKPAAKKPAAKKPAARKPATPKEPAESTPDYLVTARRMGRTCAKAMTLENEASPDDDELDEWADDWFHNNGGFDGFPGEVPDDPAIQTLLRSAFGDAFITAMRERLARPAEPGATTLMDKAAQLGDSVGQTTLAAFQEIVDEEGNSWALFDEAYLIEFENQSWGQHAEPYLDGSGDAVREKFRETYLHVVRAGVASRLR